MAAKVKKSKTVSITQLFTNEVDVTSHLTRAGLTAAVRIVQDQPFIPPMISPILAKSGFRLVPPRICCLLCIP